MILHCLENDAGSQLEAADTATSSNMVEMIFPYPNVDPFPPPKTENPANFEKLRPLLGMSHGKN